MMRKDIEVTNHKLMETRPKQYAEINSLLTSVDFSVHGSKYRLFIYPRACIRDVWNIAKEPWLHRRHMRLTQIVYILNSSRHFLPFAFGFWSSFFQATRNVSWWKTEINVPLKYHKLCISAAFLPSKYSFTNYFRHICLKKIWFM